MTDADRAAILSGHVCVIREPEPPKPRRRETALPHPYRGCTIHMAAEGYSFVRCATDDCQDRQHAVKAGLGMLQ